TKRGLLWRVQPLWAGGDILRHVYPIRSRARKIARAPFMGSSLVAASTRIEQAGLPEGYHLTATARDYPMFQDCEQRVVILASRVGDPRIAPKPPLWPLLAMLLFEWRREISASDVFARAAALGLTEEVQRGLAIVTHLFPELEGWLDDVELEIPLWERA